MSLRTSLLAIILAGLIIHLSCGSKTPAPRELVLQFVRAVQADSLVDITPYVDLDSVATYEYTSGKYKDLSLQDKKNRLFNGFVKDGEYRAVWKKSQIVVNEQNFLDDTTATVEVSFIDRATRIQYYSQMLLKLRTGKWIVTSFKVN